ncbi:small oligopeptide transporter [Mycena albidolilacea]|uniref:Small oligopeptide transporter n=1 Tax=Mycena albidolilacea TaxID=1033008 RepID=A0AAD7EFV6_9AGAR|nr:small oligopeptide transporter [Mycena albidolilacea]
MVENTGEIDSPYPEVRSAVANFDDPEMPASTIRSWILGILFSILIPGMNQFFHFRYPSVVAQLIAFPIGSTWARWMPDISLFGIKLNPGPFTAYATDVVAVQKTFYDQSFSFPFLVISTQCIGFSIGGITRRFLVAPPSMIWPNTLVSCALFNTLHSQNYAGIGKHPGMSRERFFLFAFLATATWYFVPGYLFQALRWVCWIAPDNVVSFALFLFSPLFRYKSGLGFSIITLDWNQIAYIGSPLATPWWAEANVMISFTIFYWLLVPVLYYSNVWCAHYLPISSMSAFDNTGNYYDHSRIIKGGKLDLDAYKAYSPIYLSTTFAMSYGLSFMSITATIVHAIIHFWAPIKLHFKRSLREQPDVHAKLMMAYPQVPDWYYACIFVVTFVFACVCIECWDTGMTIWALVLALCVGIVITELLVGFILPGRPLAMMMFKLSDFTWLTTPLAMQFTADFKLGHYMKIPPRPMFWCQVVATLIAGVSHLRDRISDLCSPTQPNYFNCAFNMVFGTASVIWGLVGPALFFSKGEVYFVEALVFFFIIGAACPVIQWLITRRRPNTLLNYLSFPLIFSALGQIPPATAINFVPWAVFGFIFQYVIRRKHFAYWTKYNCRLFSLLSPSLQYPLNGSIGRKSVLKWWGNTVHTNTLDWKNTPFRSLSKGETFG